MAADVAGIDSPAAAAARERVREVFTRGAEFQTRPCRELNREAGA
jgi:hypothetical protein